MLGERGYRQPKLVQRIAAATEDLPAYIGTYIDHVRKVGNSAAHANDNASAAEIVDVEPQEAEWLLELIEELFDHWYEKPRVAAIRAQEIEAKFGKKAPNISDKEIPNARQTT